MTGGLDSPDHPCFPARGGHHRPSSPGSWPTAGQGAAEGGGLPREALADLAGELAARLGADRVSTDLVELGLHSYDASLDRAMPGLVVRPADVVGLRDAVLAATAAGVPYVVRGAGTGYSGGALASSGGAVLLTADLDQIVEVDADRGIVTCRPGAVLADVKRAAETAGWRYVPDPSSWEVCTIGGNVAENAGGPHALAKGSTATYVMALDVLLPDGTTVTLDEADQWSGGLDLRSLLVGAEGTLGIVTSMRLRLVRPPRATRVALMTFASSTQALAVVGALLVERRLSPSALDMLTGAVVPGAATGDDSLLFAAFEGEPGDVAAQMAVTSAVVAEAGGTCDVLATDRFLQRRAVLVRDKVRRMVAVTGCPRYYLFDAVAPRGSLALLMSIVEGLAHEHRLPMLNTFHAGDSNVHPTPFYDPTDAAAKARLLTFSAEVLRECAAVSGSLSGEHGIGLEKRELMPRFFAEPVLDTFRAIKALVDPADLCNPGKIVPAAGRTEARDSDAGQGWADGRVVVDIADGLVKLTQHATFADVAVALAGSGFALPYEALGRTPADAVLAALDDGAPGLREPWVARARDLVVAALVERVDGQRLQLGGRCTKDVAGYELRRLLFGGRGRLGQVRAARLRVVPEPTDVVELLVRADSPDAAVRTCRELARRALPYTCLGVVGEGHGALSVVARCELRGSEFGAELDPGWTRPEAPSPWAARSMAAVAGVRSSLPWHPADAGSVPLVAEAQAHGDPFFASAGLGRIWFNHGREVTVGRSTALDDGVAAIVREGPPCPAG